MADLGWDMSGDERLASGSHVKERVEQREAGWAVEAADWEGGGDGFEGDGPEVTLVVVGFRRGMGAGVISVGDAGGQRLVGLS